MRTAILITALFALALLSLTLVPWPAGTRDRPEGSPDFLPLLARLETAPEVVTPWPGLQRRSAGEAMVPPWRELAGRTVSGCALTVTDGHLLITPEGGRPRSLCLRWRLPLAAGRWYDMHVRVGMPVTSAPWLEAIGTGTFTASVKPWVRFDTKNAPRKPTLTASEPDEPGESGSAPAGEPPRVRGPDLMAAARQLLKELAGHENTRHLLEERIQRILSVRSGRLLWGDDHLSFGADPTGQNTVLGMDLDQVAGPLHLAWTCRPHEPGRDRLHQGLYRYARGHGETALVKRMIEGPGEDRLGLLLPPGSTVGMDVTVAKNAMLAFGVKAEAPLQNDGRARPARLVVSFEPDARAADGQGTGHAPPSILHAETVTFSSHEPPDRWQDRRVPCRWPAGTRGRLRLVVESDDALRGAVVAVSDPILFRPGRALEKPSLLLITVDALRHDHVGRSEDGQPLTPQLDALAAGGVTVTHAVTTGLNTYIALPSIVTSSAVMMLGNKGFMARPELDLTTLAETLGRDGRFLRAILPDYYMNSFFKGFARRDRIDHSNVAGAEDLERVHRALAFLEQHRDEPFFLWVHLDDPHPPWWPEPGAEPPWDVPGVPDPGRDRPGEQTRCASACLANPGATPDQRQCARRFLHRNYFAEIRRADRLVGRLLSALDQLDRTRNTLVVIHADHGLTLDDRNMGGRDFSDRTIRVPLILRLPGVLPAGQTRRGVMSLLDLAPTVLALLGIPAPAEWQGVDRSAWLVGKDPCVRPDEQKNVQSGSDEERLRLQDGWAVVRYENRATVRTLPWRYERALTDTLGRGRLVADGTPPTDPINLASRYPAIAAALDRLLERGLATRDPEGFSSLPLSDAMRGFLREAGYLEEEPGAPPQENGGNRP